MASLDGIKPKKRGNKGLAAMAAGRLEQLDTLGELRKGFRGEHRTEAVCLYCYHLRKAYNLHQPEILSRAITFGLKCVPPLGEETCRIYFLKSLKCNKALDETISDMLEITPEEEPFLKSWKRAARFYVDGKHPAKPARRPVKKLKGLRRAEIEKYVKSKSEMPTVRDIRTHLEPLGLKAALATITSDLRELGIW